MNISANNPIVVIARMDVIHSRAIQSLYVLDSPRIYDVNSGNDVVAGFGICEGRVG